MRQFLFLAAVVVIGSANAQVKQAPVAAKPTGTVSADKPPVPLETIHALEMEMDSRIAATGGATDPCVVQAPTRGFYLNRLGAVFTAEVSLAPTPGGVALFQTAVGADQKARIHKSKLAHIPMIEQTLREMIISLAASPALKLGENDQVVVAVRFFDQKWEDRTGLPFQMVARLDHRGGAIKVEVQ